MTVKWIQKKLLMVIIVIKIWLFLIHIFTDINNKLDDNDIIGLEEENRNDCENNNPWCAFDSDK